MLAQLRTPKVLEIKVHYPGCFDAFLQEFRSRGVGISDLWKYAAAMYDGNPDCENLAKSDSVEYLSVMSGLLVFELQKKEKNLIAGMDYRRVFLEAWMNRFYAKGFSETASRRLAEAEYKRYQQQEKSRAKRKGR